MICERLFCLVVFCALVCTSGVPAVTVRIGRESVLSLHARSEYCRYVNWRPADGEVVDLNPPRLSWPYWPDWPDNFSDALHLFTLQLSANPDCSQPVVDVVTQCNFYNTVPALDPERTWYWRVGYDVGTAQEHWSAVRSFRIAPQATVWDRSALAPERLRVPEHPRVLFTAATLRQLRSLAQTNPDSAAALAYMISQADRIMQKPWWNDFPTSDRGPEPKQAFYTIAGDLALVAFVWQMTGDDTYAGVLERAVTWASYPPGGRASPEGLGGDGAEDATQGNEFLALLFDWLYPHLSEEQREIMVRSLEWRVDHVMNSFSWRARGRAGPLLRLTLRSGAARGTIEAEATQLRGGAHLTDSARASGGRAVALTTGDAAISVTVPLQPGTWIVTVLGYAPTTEQDAFHIRLDNGSPQRVFIQGWGEATASFRVEQGGEHTITVSADAGEVGMQIDAVRFAMQTDERLYLPAATDWRRFDWEVSVPTSVSTVVVEAFNYYARGEVAWADLHVATSPGGPNLLSNADFSQVADGTPTAWRFSDYRTQATGQYVPQGGPGAASAVAISCPQAADRGAWGQTMRLQGDAGKLYISGYYRTGGGLLAAPVRASGMAGMISSHPYEAAMDTAVCGLVLWEHSPIGREWFELCLNYLIGVTVGHGFDEGWNEGAGYGTSKCKWLMNATIYCDTALPDAHLGLNPRYRVLGDWFCRVIPVGMDHHAWGDQANASRGNHLAHMREFAHLTGEGRFLFNWQQYGGQQFSKFRPWITYALPAHYSTPIPEPEREFTRVFPIDGWAMAATGPPSDARTYAEGVGLIFQCRPRGGYSHSYNSDGSFQLHAYGQMLNHGGGTSANQDAYAYHTMSHNTILVDGLGQAQPASGMLYPAYGRIVGHAEGKDFFYVAGDVTLCYPRQPGNYSRWGLPLHEVYQQRALPYLERFVRHIVFMRGKYFVIHDDLECSQPARYTWLYHIRPTHPITFDPQNFRVWYDVGPVKVCLQHVYRPDQLQLDDREGLEGLTNPFTGEDYRALLKGEIICGHNLWVTNRQPAADWRFLAVVVPQAPGEGMPAIVRVDDHTVRVGSDVICFDAQSAAAAQANVVVDVAAFRGGRQPGSLSGR